MYKEKKKTGKKANRNERQKKAKIKKQHDVKLQLASRFINTHMLHKTDELNGDKME